MLTTVNGRFLTQPLTGVQRYAYEVLRRLPATHTYIPTASVCKSGLVRALPTQVHTPHKLVQATWHCLPRSFRGHFWEQFVLGTNNIVRKQRLWSPCNVGPLHHKHHCVTIHDLAPIEFPDGLSEKFRRWYCFLMPRLILRAQKIIAVSEYTRQSILKRYHVPDSKVVTVYNGVDHQSFFPERDDLAQNTLEHLGISGPYVLTVGSLVARKNLKGLLRAWPKVQSTAPNLTLVVVGGQGSRNVFESMAGVALSQGTKFLGKVTDVQLRSLYTKCSLYVQVSKYEGFGLPVVEAMACGAPVLVSNVTALPEVVGECGILCDPYNHLAISNAILDTLRCPDRLARLRIESARRAKKFSWDQCAARTAAAIGSVMVE